MGKSEHEGFLDLRHFQSVLSTLDLHSYSSHTAARFAIPIKVTRCPYGSFPNVGTSENECFLKLDFQMPYVLGLRTRIVAFLPYIFQSLGKLLKYHYSSQPNVGTSEHGGVFDFRRCFQSVFHTWGLHSYSALLPYIFQSLWKLLDVIPALS